MNKKLFTYQSWLLKITMITFWGVVFCQCKSDNDLPEPDSPEPEGEIPLITKLPLMTILSGTGWINFQFTILI